MPRRLVVLILLAALASAPPVRRADQPQTASRSSISDRDHTPASPASCSEPAALDAFELHRQLGGFVGLPADAPRHRPDVARCINGPARINVSARTLRSQHVCLQV
jgi:hypothetical protein